MLLMDVILLNLAVFLSINKIVYGETLNVQPLPVRYIHARTVQAAFGTAGHEMLSHLTHLETNMGLKHGIPELK